MTTMHYISGVRFPAATENEKSPTANVGFPKWQLGGIDNKQPGFFCSPVHGASAARKHAPTCGILSNRYHSTHAPWSIGSGDNTARSGSSTSHPIRESAVYAMTSRRSVF
jgi:hypothetical protein